MTRLKGGSMANNDEGEENDDDMVDDSSSYSGLGDREPGIDLEALSPLSSPLELLPLFGTHW